MDELVAAGTASVQVRSVGGKAAALARLTAAGFAVPGFFVVRSEAFVRHLTDSSLAWPAARDQITAAPLPHSVAGPLRRCYRALCSVAGHDKVAVRSSGAGEDSEQDSFAGQFDSTLNISGLPALTAAVKACWASSLSDRSLAYRARRGLPVGTEPSFGVIVQTQVFPRVAGVLFTEHPMDSSAAYIEANFGTAESVVASLVTPDGIILSRAGGRVIEIRVGTKRRMTAVSPDTQGSTLVELPEELQKAPVLSSEQAEELLTLGMGIEQLAGRPQDIEWAIDGERIWVIQSRPITAKAGAQR